MEFRLLALYATEMFLKGMKTRWLALPLSAFFLFLSTGAAAAPDCHIESTVQPTSQSEAVHSHSAHPHSHPAQVTSSAVLNSQETRLSLGGIFSDEICIVIGFIVLLLLRFSLLARSNIAAKPLSPQSYQLPLFLSKNLGYLNLNHLQLGIIRI